MIPNLSQIVAFRCYTTLVAAVMIRAASMCTASSCFLKSTDALSHTESQYSNSGRTKDMYICSNDLRLTLNFRARSKLSLVNLLLTILFMEKYRDLLKFSLAIFHGQSFI